MPPLPNIENILFLNDRTLTMHCDRYKQVGQYKEVAYTTPSNAFGHINEIADIEKDNITRQLKMHAVQIAKY